MRVSAHRKVVRPRARMEHGPRAALAAVLAIGIVAVAPLPAFAATPTTVKVRDQVVVASPDEWSDLSALVSACAGAQSYSLVGDVTAPNGQQLSIPSGCAFTLDLNGHTLSIQGAQDAEAAVGVPPGASLRVNATGGGTLSARNPNGSGAAIGGDQGQSCGTVVLAGGTISAWSSRGAGIGGGSLGTPGDGCALTIDGARVTAENWGLAAGIGGGGIGTGTGGSGGTVLVLSGSVDAKTGNFASGGAAIGAGLWSNANPGTLTIAGTRYGSVQAAGQSVVVGSAPMDGSTPGSMSYRMVVGTDPTHPSVSIRFGHVVAFDPNYPGGLTGTPATLPSAFVADGQTIASAAPDGPGGFPTPSLADWALTGWETVANAPWTASTAVTSSLVLRARWAAYEYGVAFTCDHAVCATTPTNGTIGAGDTVTLTHTADPGYHFTLWSSAQAGVTFAAPTSASTTFAFPSLGGPDGATIDVTGAVAPNTYTLQFDSNGGDGAMAPKVLTYDQATGLDPATLTRANHWFAGWATTAGGAVAFGDGATVTNLTATDGGTVTLYAVWQELTGALSVTTVDPGDSLTVIAEGFPAGHPVQVVLHSNPVLLTTTITNGLGELSALVTVPAGTGPGAHRIVLTDTATGATLSLALRVRPGAAIAYTGSEPGGWLWLGLGFLGVGLLAVRFARRRRA